MANTSNENGWNEWSRHVLAELQRLNDGITSLNCKIDCISTTLSKHEVVIDKINQSNIFEECSKNTEFRNDIKALLFKMALLAAASGGAAGWLIDFLT